MANDLLKQAIADAKAVRETALANAKLALEEAFTPRIQSMLSNRIAEEEEMEEGMHGDEEILMLSSSVSIFFGFPFAFLLSMIMW